MRLTWTLASGELAVKPLKLIRVFASQSTISAGNTLNNVELTIKNNSLVFEERGLHTIENFVRLLVLLRNILQQ